ncbi:MAG: hypothetical protein Q4Q53_00730 [Methanocorpusculum sp.]|nr:hypothetical protein [Methanocorpusculum sp.]
MKHFHQILIILITITAVSAGCITADVPEKIAAVENTYSPQIIEHGVTEGFAGEIIEITFPFKNHTIKKQIAVSNEKYNCLPDKNSEERTLYDGKTYQEKYTYFSSFINNRANQEIYSQILDLFDKYSQEYSLTSDEYIELAVSYVQNITYNTSCSSSKFPIETIFENNGDCDDKSILLAALLSEKGYDTALFFFEKDRHMTAAVKSGNETAYPQANGYSIIETTGLNYVGEISKSLKLSDNTSITISSKPDVYKIGNGEIPYTASNEVAEILKMRETCASEISRIDILMDELSDKISAGESLPQQLADTRTFNEYADLHNEYAYLANLISSEPFNRAFVYSQVKKMEADIL